MFRRTVADFVEFNTLVHLLVEALACRAVGWMEGGIVTIGAAAPAHLSVTVGAGKTAVERNLDDLSAEAIFKVIALSVVVFICIGKFKI